MQVEKNPSRPPRRHRPCALLRRITGSGRGAGYPAPPPQIPACGFPAPGSCRGSNATGVRGLNGPCTPARRLAASVTCLVRHRVRSMCHSLPSPRPAAFPPHPPPPTWSALFGASSVVRGRPTPPAFRGGFALLSFPPRPGAAWAAAGDRRSPRFRRDPFVRELVSDPGRAAAPRITAPLMLPSALWTASAPALQLISWLNTDPTRWLCTLRRGRRLPRRNTRYRRALPLTWAGLAPAGPRQLRLAHPKPSLGKGATMAVGRGFPPLSLVQQTRPTSGPDRRNAMMPRF